MKNSASIRNPHEITIRPLAPVIPLKPVPKKTNRQKRKVLKPKPEPGLPLFYDKPIYKPKKHDLF